MTSHDIFFSARPGAEPPTVEAVRAWLSARPRWTVDESRAAYENPHTGVDLAGLIEADAEAPPGRVPAVLWMVGLRAHNAIEEAADEYEAFAGAFDLLVVEDRETNATRRFDREWLRADHEKFNRWLHEHHFRHEAYGHDEVLDRARLDQVMRWNRNRDALAAASGDAVFVPHILFFQRGDRVGTFVAWADGIAARIPPVDAIQTTRTFAPWSAVADAIGAARREDDHWLVDGEALAAVFAALDAAESEPPPRLVPPREVLTQDIVDEYLLPVEVREPQRRGRDLHRSGRMSMMMGRDPLKAVAELGEAALLLADEWSVQSEVAQVALNHNPALALRCAERAMALIPGAAVACLVGAVGAMYLTSWDQALQLAARALELSPDDRNAHLVRATVLTELMRWDEAIAACDAALALETDAMAMNVKAFTLAAAGRSAEAEAAYRQALQELDPALAESPDDADLHERRAYTLLGLGRPEEARAAAKKALALEKDAYLALQSLGRAALALGRAKEAAKVLRKVVGKLRRSPMAAFHLAKAHAALGQIEERDAALTTAAASPLYAALAAHDPALQT